MFYEDYQLGLGLCRQELGLSDIHLVDKGAHHERGSKERGHGQVKFNMKLVID